MNEPRPIPGYVKSLRTLADKTIQIVVETQELEKESAAYLFSLVDKYGYLAFFENAQEVDGLDLPEHAPEFKNDKTPSQRLRAVMFVWHKQQKSDEPFEVFYLRKMNELIDHIKAKLEPI